MRHLHFASLAVALTAGRDQCHQEPQALHLVQVGAELRRRAVATVDDPEMHQSLLAVNQRFEAAMFNRAMFFKGSDNPSPTPSPTPTPAPEAPVQQAASAPTTQPKDMPKDVPHKAELEGKKLSKDDDGEPPRPRVKDPLLDEEGKIEDVVAKETKTVLTAMRGPGRAPVVAAKGKLQP